MKIAFLLYPTRQVKVEEDSSFWIMLELQKRGHPVFYFESKHLVGLRAAPHAYLTPAKLDMKKGYLPSPLRKELTDLTSFDCLFIRKEPPFGLDYLYSMQLLDIIKDRVFILNSPSGIMIANEKIFVLAFKDLIPESCVTDNADSARKFIRHIGRKIVVKPLDDKGGVGVFALSPDDKSLLSLLDMATVHGNRKVMIQRYLPENKRGDKRILILNGEPLGAFSRRPGRGDFRANLSAGGVMHRAALTDQDREIVESMRDELLRNGLFFVGIDVIGNYLTEVNVTSPAGIPEINRFDKAHLERKVADFIERRR